MNHRADQCGCTQDIGMSRAHIPHYCDHGNLLTYSKSLARSTFQKTERPRKRLKTKRGFAASPAQQRKVRNLPCVTCGRDRHETTIDPAHLWPRSRAACDCPDGVVPLCRDCHRLFDDGQYDLLGALVNRGYHAEIAHAIAVHQAPLTQLLERLTATKWQPTQLETGEQDERRLRRQPLHGLVRARILYSTKGEEASE